MKLSILFLLVAVPALVSCSTVQCGQWDTTNTGPFTVYNNLWGEGGASSGSQCYEITSVSGNTISWTTNWTWTGGNGIKSYSNVQYNTGVGKQLSAISSIPSTWTWSYATTGTIVADVAWDIWTSSTAKGSNEYEIMIWLAAYGGAEPISNQWGPDGKPVPVTTFSNGGHTYNFYVGVNSSWKVLSFVPTSGTVTNFSGDLKAFFTFMINGKYIAATQYLNQLQAGTEPTTGKGTLTNKYTVDIK